MTQTEYEGKGFEDKEVRRLYKLSANYLITELPRTVEKLKITDYSLEERINPENFAEFIVVVYKGVVSSSGAQLVLEEMFRSGADPTHIIQTQDLAQVSDVRTLERIIDEVIENNPQPTEDYKKGKESALQFLIGQVMKATKGKANPQVVGEVLRKKLR